MNDLLKGSFELPRGQSSRDGDIELGEQGDQGLEDFSKKVQEIDKQYDKLDKLLKKLQAAHEESKAVTKAPAMRVIKKKMEKDVDEVGSIARFIKGKLETLDRELKQLFLLFSLTTTMTSLQCSPPFASPSSASLSPALYLSYSSLSPSSASLSSSMRLWRPAAQRNLRNQWSKLSSCRQQWVVACSGGRSQATSLVNSHLSQIYMPMMELGVLSDMADIKKKALEKLFNQQSAYRRKLLSSYKEMVAVVVEMVNASRSLKSYIKPSNGSLIQFSNSTDNASDTGDCSGVPVYSFWSISAFEKIAEEFVEMFKCEIMLKRLLLLELMALSSEVPQPVKLSWSAELYNGEFDDLTKCSLYTIETSAPNFPRVGEEKPGNPSQTHTKQPTSVNLQVYLTTWLAEVNINIHRVDEILALVGEEIRVTF